jgi:CheY-like chemotaxis protein
MDQRGQVVIEVRDTGSGMPPEVMKRLFTPFFTTKPVGQGTGLGLSICHRMVTALGGTIAVESEVGKGSVFRVCLPPAAPESDVLPALSERPGTLQTGPRGRILVIDDEEPIARAVQRILKGEHEVVLTHAAMEAIARIRAGERFDVILCDLMMPEVTGMEFYGLLQALAPAQAERVVFVTGGAFTPKARAFLDEVPNARLEKPFESRSLRALIRDRMRPPLQTPGE